MQGISSPNGSRDNRTPPEDSAKPETVPKGGYRHKNGLRMEFHFLSKRRVPTGGWDRWHDLPGSFVDIFAPTIEARESISKFNSRFHRSHLTAFDLREAPEPRHGTPVAFARVHSSAGPASSRRSVPPRLFCRTARRYASSGANELREARPGRRHPRRREEGWRRFDAPPSRIRA